jgi:hypothetical protein
MTKLKYNPLSNSFDYVSSADDFYGDFYPSSLGTAISSNFLKSGTAEINELIDVDTQTSPPTRDYVLKWNGTKWVPALYNASFVFSINVGSFSDGEGTTQLIGAAGTWRALSTTSFSVAYTNGPPDSAWVQLSNNGGAYAKVGTMTGPTYTTGTNDAATIPYPTTRGQYLRFRISAQCGSDNDNQLETSIYFHNYVRYGTTTTASGWSSTEINALGGSVTSTYATSYAINATAGQYLILAYPSTYTSIHISGMIFNSVMCPFEDVATISVTNSSGYVENYKVHRSTLTNLGNYTLVASTSDTRINKIYYGGSTKSSTYLESDVEGLNVGTVTNDQTQVWTLVALTAGQYFIFAIPSRLSTPTFWDYGTGFGASFESPETVAVTNVNGHTENYKVFRSTNILGPGNFQLETK